MPHLPLPPAYCPRCGTSLPAAAPGARPACRRGHYTWYADPKLAVGVVPVRNGEILLVRRNHEPAYGRWAFPSGFVDAGEVVEEAARREVREETGVEVELDALLGVYSEPDEQVVFVAYAGTIVAGEAVAGDEAIEVAFFDPEALPDLPFPHDQRVIEAWRAHRARR
ncbi:MAG: NUDIX hydrolase [Chloroflexi bacterium]|nr:NUDIX hydrolase [Chloroflexota bacterium]MDA1004464.1 NUDIX hydrolase [Chloroflexota bacterium]